MKKTATIVRMNRPVKNGMYTDKYTVTYESGVTRTFKIIGGMIKAHLDFMMSADVEVIRTESGKRTSDVFCAAADVDYRIELSIYDILKNTHTLYNCVTEDEAKAYIKRGYKHVKTEKTWNIVTKTFERSNGNYIYHITFYPVDNKTE